MVAAGAAALLVAAVGARSASGAAAGCHPSVSLLVRAQGSPDDLAWEGSQLLVSDINRGTIGTVVRGRVKTLVGHIREPEGIVPRPPHSLVVAEQATNRVLLVNLCRRSSVPILTLPLPPGRTGVDDIEAAPRGGVYVPDSANGRLYLLRGGRLALLASGMSRPVGALDWGRGVAVADEYANTVWLVRGRSRTRLADLLLPDDLAVVAHHLIAVSLAGGVWEIAPHRRLLSKAFRDPQGLVAAGPSALLVADQSTNAIYRVAGLAACLR